jgi:hypothetical protein
MKAVLPLNLKSKIFNRFVYLMTTFLLILAFAPICPVVNAQTTNQVNGEIGSTSANYIWITNVKAYDQVLITITPQEGDPHYESRIYASNLTQVSFDQGYTSWYGSRTYYGRHENNFVADSAGNYLLVITTDGGYAFSYTVKSELHQLKTQIMEKTQDTIGISDIDYFWINNVKANELVLLCITPQSGEPYYQSSVSLSQTEVSYNQGYTSSYGSRTYYGRHNHEFIAQEDGNYKLKISTDSSNTFNYTLSVAHVNPTTLLADKPIPSTSEPTSINNGAGTSVTFKVPDDFPEVFDGQLSWDYGDGTVVSTNNRTTTHVYQTPGNYVFTLRLKETTDTRIIDSFPVVIVNNLIPTPTKIEPTIPWTTILATVAAVISAIVAALGLYYKLVKKVD